MECINKSHPKYKELISQYDELTAIKMFMEYEKENNNLKSIEDFNDEDSFYRVVVGDEAFNDIVNSQLIRTNADNKPKISVGISLGNRPTAFPSFSKGRASADYANNNPNNYIIVSKDPSIKPSTLGRHGKGSTFFPTDENGNQMKSIPADNVEVWKHVGNSQYEKMYIKKNLDILPQEITDITQEEWNNLTEEEKTKIKNCI